MQILIRYFDGRLEEVLPLSISGNTIRAAVAGYDDFVEFTLHDGQWLSDAKEPIEIEFLTMGAEDEWRVFCDELVAIHELSQADGQALLAVCPTQSTTGTWEN